MHQTCYSTLDSFILLSCSATFLGLLMLTLQKNKLWRMFLQDNSKIMNVLHSAGNGSGLTGWTAESVAAAWLILQKPCFIHTVTSVNAAVCHNNTVSGQGCGTLQWSGACDLSGLHSFVCAAAVALGSPDARSEICFIWTTLWDTIISEYLIANVGC